jgi:hypothetical protein
MEDAPMDGLRFTASRSFGERATWGCPSDRCVICGDARDLIQAHVEAIRRKRAELDSLEHALNGMAARCDAICAADPAKTCTIFDDVLESVPGSEVR